MNYAGKRVIVAGATDEFIARLAELGAEAHVIGTTKPVLPGIASFTECDLADNGQIDAAVKKIGKIVNVVFDCVGSPHLVAVVVPNMIEGSSVVTLADPEIEPPPKITIRVVPTVDAMLANVT
jgi:NADPH:quinone reductase-like Zn-dependent oxidoreductase